MRPPLRSLSVLASSAAVPLIYLLGRELLGRREGLLGAALFALSPTAIYYAQEVRSYALLLLPLTMTLLCLARFLRAPHANRDLAGYAVFAIMSLYCHVTMLMVICCLQHFRVQRCAGRQPV